MRRAVAQPVIMEIGGHRQPAFAVHCRRCRVRAGMPAKANYGMVNFIVLRKHFDRLGWDLGHNPQTDTCPKCVEVYKQERRAAHGPLKRFHPAAEALFHKPVHQFGPTVAELKALQAKFSDESPDQIRAKIEKFEKAIRILRGRLLSLVVAEPRAVMMLERPKVAEPTPALMPPPAPRPAPLWLWLD